MSVIASEVLIVLGLLLLNGVFALSELAIVSARKVRLEHRAARGDAGARAALAIAREPAEFLSAVQVGITLVGVLSGAFGGATIAEELAKRFAQVPALAPHAEAIGLGIVVAAITYLSLIIGELVPKRIALNSPERIAAMVSRPMRLVAKIATPLVWLLTTSTNVVLRLLRIRGHAEPAVTEEEIRAMVEQGAESGVVQAAEHEIVESVFRMGDRQVGTIMTPRPEVEWLDLSDSPDTLRAALGARLRGQWVVSEEALDHVVGVVDTQRLLAKLLAGETLDLPGDLRRLATEPLYVPASMPVLRLLQEFRDAHRHFALVLDEFGGIEGVVTLDDILTALVGDVPSRAEAHAPAIERRADGSWLVDGTLPIDDLVVEFDVDPLTSDERRGFRTVAGFILSKLGRIPRPGEGILWRGVRFEVREMEGRRIDRVLVSAGPRLADTAE